MSRASSGPELCEGEKSDGGKDEWGEGGEPLVSCDKFVARGKSDVRGAAGGRGQGGVMWWGVAGTLMNEEQAGGKAML